MRFKRPQSKIKLEERLKSQVERTRQQTMVALSDTQQAEIQGT